MVFATLYFTKDSEPAPVAAQPCGDRTFGHIRSLEREGGRYQLRFDPALWLSGETANTAAAEVNGTRGLDLFEPLESGV